MSAELETTETYKTWFEGLKKTVVSTPMVPSDLTEDQRIEIIEGHFAEIMKALDLDLSDDSLNRTPYRVAKMYVREIYKGLWDYNFPKITTIKNTMGVDFPVTEGPIKVMSSCEHHFVTIDGFAYISYFPGDKVIGLSKMNRLVNHYARRPQVQERLTKQIADAMCYILGVEDVGVWIDAKHYCVASRGIEDQNSRTVTCDLRGKFRLDPKVREEFMLTVNRR